MTTNDISALIVLAERARKAGLIEFAEMAVVVQAVEAGKKLIESANAQKKAVEAPNAVQKKEHSAKIKAMPNSLRRTVSKKKSHKSHTL